jgi:ribosomal protein S18 acetylase RimI-like enzyme
VQLVHDGLDDTALADALEQARLQGIHLLYWAIAPERQPAEDLLRAYTGSLVDRKTTWVATLPSGTRNGHAPTGFSIDEFPRGPALTSLRDLAVTAGAYSRFRVDSRVPVEKWRSLFHLWMERSTKREMADQVLVVRPEASPSDIQGVVTVAKGKRDYRIGLIAVNEVVRGVGLGTHLLYAAHDWLIGNSVRVVTVVTQGDNQPACRLYERAGYRILNVKHIYHFWPRAEGNR